MTSPTTQIILDSPSRAWRRRLGPLPWAILEELAQQACRSKQGWVVAVGVRDLGATVGVTKDTAARALATLRSAGIVTPARVQGSDGWYRSGYQLNLPDGITITSRPNNQDTNQRDNGAHPDGEHTRGRHGKRSDPGGASAVRTHNVQNRESSIPPPQSRRLEQEGFLQPSLFDAAASPSS